MATQETKDKRQHLNDEHHQANHDTAPYYLDALHMEVHQKQPFCKHTHWPHILGVNEIILLDN